VSLDERINEILNQVKQLCVIINKRMKELGDVDVFTYRDDPVIKDCQAKICSLYRKAMSLCKQVSETINVCRRFMSEPECLQQLLLAEEVACYGEGKE